MQNPATSVIKNGESWQMQLCDPNEYATNGETAAKTLVDMKLPQ